MSCVVGLAGGSASGKSTLAAAVVDALGPRCLHITHDRYYRSLPDALAHDPLSHDFDAPDSLDTAQLVRDLIALRAGHSVTLPRYDYSHHRRADQGDEARPAEVILVEGILLLEDASLRAQLDLMVFVEAAAGLRLARRLRRDSADRGRSEAAIRARYERFVRPAHERWVAPSMAHAHQVLDGSAPITELVDQLLALIEDCNAQPSG